MVGSFHVAGIPADWTYTSRQSVKVLNINAPLMVGLRAAAGEENG